LFVDEDPSLPACKAVPLDEWFLTCRRCILVSSAGKNSPVFLDSLTLKIKVIQYFETSGNISPVTQNTVFSRVISATAYFAHPNF